MAFKEHNFVGGPYNGNSFAVAEEADVWPITSSSAIGTTNHIYVRTGDDEFTYDHTEAQPVLQMGDRPTGVQSGNGE